MVLYPYCLLVSFYPVALDNLQPQRSALFPTLSFTDELYQPISNSMVSYGYRWHAKIFSPLHQLFGQSNTIQKRISTVNMQVYKLICHTNVYYNRVMGGKLKIILVEDDVSFAELLANRLEEFGFQVEHYEDGASFWI